MCGVLSIYAYKPMNLRKKKENGNNSGNKIILEIFKRFGFVSILLEREEGNMLDNEENSTETSNNNESTQVVNKNKWFLIITVVVALLIVALAGMNYNNNKQFNSHVALADNLLSQDKLSVAVDNYNIALGYKKDSAVQDKLVLANKLGASNDCFNKATDAFNNKDYLTAYNNYKLVIPEDTKRYESAQAKMAESLNAIELEKQIKEARKQKLLAMTTANYDDMKNETIIVPKGLSTRYVSFGDVNIFPKMTVDLSGKAVLYIVAGFEQKDWIFFDNIIFDADGYKFTWDVSGLNQTFREVYWGGIAEWTVMTQVSKDMATFSQQNQHDNRLSSELVEQMSILANSTSAKMRFEGKGYRDHVLTSSEKANLETFMELYGYYEHTI
jgi:hypothetical protein